MMLCVFPSSRTLIHCRTPFYSRAFISDGCDSGTSLAVCVVYRARTTRMNGTMRRCVLAAIAAVMILATEASGGKRDTTLTAAAAAGQRPCTAMHAAMSSGEKRARVQMLNPFRAYVVNASAAPVSSLPQRRRRTSCSSSSVASRSSRSCARTLHSRCRRCCSSRAARARMA
jgi:hypothetical protein